MSIPKDLVLLIAALLIAGAVPAASGAVVDFASVVKMVPEQRTSDAKRRSGAAAPVAGGAGALFRGGGLADRQSVVAAMAPRAAATAARSGAVLAGSESVEAHGSVVDPDTLRKSVRGGEVVIIDLPEELDASSVDGYSIIRAPALSWLVDCSFMWRTLPEDVGMHDILVRAEGTTDTLIVSITVE